MSVTKIPLTDENIEKITEKFPTPFHIYDEKAIRENARELLRTFAWDHGFKEYFAVKSAEMLFEPAVEILEKLDIRLDFTNISGGIGIPYRPYKKKLI